ncbi:hypothetical protein AWENTII_003954 [Aspergillus wentii]
MITATETTGTTTATAMVPPTESPELSFAAVVDIADDPPVEDAPFAESPVV